MSSKFFQRYVDAHLLNELPPDFKNYLFVEELLTLAEQMQHFLMSESAHNRRRVLGLFCAFKERYCSQIRQYPLVDSFVQNIELTLSLEDVGNVDRSSWIEEKLHEDAAKVPNMLHEESFLYYNWLGRNYQGFGEIIEIGCWMGATTFTIGHGLSGNIKCQAEKRIHAFDSFVWNEAFHKYRDHETLKHLKTGDDFLPSFLEYTKRFSEYIVVHKHYFDSNRVSIGADEKVRLVGSNHSIEYLIQDICPDYGFNQYILQLFKFYFVDRKTLIVYGQYGNLFARQLRQFVADNGRHLIPTHKVRGNVKAFLYKE